MGVNYFIPTIIIVKTRLIPSILFLAFLFLFNYSNAQETSIVAPDSTFALAMNINSVSENDEKTEANEEIIDKKKSQTSIKNALTKREININKGRTSFKFKYGGRIQTRYDLWKVQESGAEAEGKLYFRRVRFKSDGHLFTPKIGYKLEVDIIGAQILDAILKWNFYKNFEIWAGQSKLRGNRERVISSQNLQFVDRSLLNSKFTLDRDIGVWLTHHFNA